MHIFRTCNVSDKMFELCLSPKLGTASYEITGDRVLYYFPWHDASFPVCSDSNVVLRVAAVNEYSDF